MFYKLSFRKLLMLLFTAVATISLTSCSDDDDGLDESSLMVGEWTYTNVSLELTSIDVTAFYTSASSSDDGIARPPYNADELEELATLEQDYKDLYRQLEQGVQDFYIGQSITFNEDGTATFSFGSTPNETVGTWRLEGNRLYGTVIEQSENASSTLGTVESEVLVNFGDGGNTMSWNVTQTVRTTIEQRGIGGTFITEQLLQFERQE
jgi:hypothetical protein